MRIPSPMLSPDDTIETAVMHLEGAGRILRAFSASPEHCTEAALYVLGDVMFSAATYFMNLDDAMRAKASKA
jgi:hypothetical protein